MHAQLDVIVYELCDRKLQFVPGLARAWGRLI